MKGFIAALYKDLRLMFNGTGVATVFLALLLLPLFIWGTRDLKQDDFVRPFPVAMRDLDKTLMSRSLMSQIAEIELFSEVRILDTGTDEEALLNGAAAVITVPEGFFYAMYTGADCPVTVTLNDSSRLESALVSSIFTSVMDIVTADQAAWRGIYRYVYGDDMEAHLTQMYEEASRNIFSDALSRQRVFETDITSSDTLIVTRRRLTAVLLPMLTMLFCLSALQTLPQEWEAGMLLRFRVAGAPVSSFILSKAVSAFFWIVPFAVLLYLLSGVARYGLFVLLVLLTFFSSFSVMLAIVSWAADENSARRFCNIYLLWSLIFGGTLIVTTHLPAVYRPFQYLVAARYVFPVLNAMAQGEGAGRVFVRMMPFVITTVIGFGLAAAGMAHRLRRHERRAAMETTGDVRGETVHASRILQSPPVTAVRLSGQKLLLYAGGVPALVLVCISLLAAGYAVRHAADYAASSVTVFAVDADDTDSSRALLTRVQKKAGESIRLITGSLADGEASLVDGSAEGMLVIGAGYEAALMQDAMTPLAYQSTASAFSAQGVREVIAGQVAAERAYFRAYREVQSLTGETLTEADMKEIDRLIDAAADTLPALSEVRSMKGSAGADPFLPDRLSFLALCVVLMILTAAACTGRRDARASKIRLTGRRGFVLLTSGADLMALTAFGVLLSVCFYLACGRPSWREAAAALLLSMTVSAFALWITNLTAAAGRLDALAPVLTLLVCLAGGCFLDLSALSAGIARLMMLSPAGAALFVKRGLLSGAGVMCLESALFAFFARPRRR